MSKLQQLRQDAGQAEERAGQVSEEAKQLAHALEERRANLDSRAQNLVMSRNKVDKLAQVRKARTSKQTVSWFSLPRLGAYCTVLRPILYCLDAVLRSVLHCTVLKVCMSHATKHSKSDSWSCHVTSFVKLNTHNDHNLQACQPMLGTYLACLDLV